MIVILSIYALEIHNYDLYKRSQASLDIKLKASQKLLDSSDVSYKLDIVSLTHQIKYSTRGSLFRKIKTAFIFDTERFIFYIVPLAGLLWLDKPKKKRRLKGKNNYFFFLYNFLRRKKKLNRSSR